jgi:hypothetical protein
MPRISRPRFRIINRNNAHVVRQRHLCNSLLHCLVPYMNLCMAWERVLILKFRRVTSRVEGLQGSILVALPDFTEINCLMSSSRRSTFPRHEPLFSWASDSGVAK